MKFMMQPAEATTVRVRDGATVTTDGPFAETAEMIGGYYEVELPDLDHALFSAECGKGTYVRSLARDMGRALGSAAHVTILRRVAVGPFTEAHMISLENLEELGHKAPGGDAKTGALLPIETVLDGIPALVIDEEQARRLKLGQAVLLRGANAPIAEDAVLVMSGGKPLGIGTIVQGSLKPKRLFNL